MRHGSRRSFLDNPVPTLSQEKGEVTLSQFLPNAGVKLRKFPGKGGGLLR